jgi:hypothetical protein
MKKIKFLAPILAFAMFSCDNYLDINESPNDLTFDKATPSKLLPGAQVSTYRVQVGAMNELGNVFMNSWTRNVNSYGNGYDKELQLIIDNSFANPIFEGIGRNLINFQAIIDYPNPTGRYDNFIAAAKICKAHYMQYAVDLYGDVPYSEAWKGSDDITPAYDDDYAIYQDLIANLEDARALIAAANPNADDIAPYDVMLAGDMAKWNEFANTIQLRMCLRMSETTGAVATYRDSKLADIVSGPFITESVTINPGFSGASDDQASPGFNRFAHQVDGTARGNRLFIAMTGHAYKAMTTFANTNYTGTATAGSQELVVGSGVLYPNVTDPRRARLFTAGLGAGGFVRAVNQGSSAVDVSTPAAPMPGPPARLGLIGNFDLYAEHPGATFDDYSGASGYIMLYSEACFLLAEAAARADNGEAGYAGFTGAQGWFDAGVTDSVLSRVATMGSYLTTINTRPNFGYTASTTFDQQLHAIMYQKWIALMGVHGMESFVDYNRTGYPLTPLASVATQARKPYRLFYPVSEYIANAANVPNLTTSELFTINAKSPFWLQ